jgi:hypothetical protein
MNTPRQQTLPTPTEQILGEMRDSWHYGRPSTSSNTPRIAGRKPAATIINSGATPGPPLPGRRPVP